jgi:hypothetical protein
MKQTLSLLTLKVLLACTLLLAGCNLPRVAPTSAPLSPGTLPVNPPSASPSEEPTNPSSAGGMQVRFVNVTEGGSIPAVMAQSQTDSLQRPLVILQVEVTGGATLDITLTANGAPALDESNRTSVATNLSGAAPFTGEIRWSPMNGGGEYTLVAIAMDANKQVAQATIHVTVTGVTAFTSTPPPLDQAAAFRRISNIIQQTYGVTIPKAPIQRFDFPNLPGRSRWIGAAYYTGERYYVELYDDSHYELSPGEYADPAHRSSRLYYVYCKPAGLYRVLILFVDYGNVSGVDQKAALAQVPLMADWLNQQYTNFAISQGFASAPMQVEVAGAFVAAPPSPGNLLRVDEIRSLTGFDANAYDLVIQIDFDANNTYANTHWPGLFPDVGGGIALQGCGSFEDPQTRVNIWSGLDDPANVQGALFMDLSHEMSHLFGMLDSWPFTPAGLTRPDGTPGDDWIPYVMFGWTDTDGDGIPEIIDSTPYGTSGPQP